MQSAGPVSPSGQSSLVIGGGSSLPLVGSASWAPQYPVLKSAVSRSVNPGIDLASLLPSQFPPPVLRSSRPLVLQRLRFWFVCRRVAPRGASSGRAWGRVVSLPHLSCRQVWVDRPEVVAESRVERECVQGAHLEVSFLCYVIL